MSKRNDLITALANGTHVGSRYGKMTVHDGWTFFVATNGVRYSVVVYTQGEGGEHRVRLAGNSLEEIIEKLALHIKAKGQTRPDKHGCVCHRCLGNEQAYARYNINDGRCFVCNGAGWYWSR